MYLTLSLLSSRYCHAWMDPLPCFLPWLLMPDYPITVRSPQQIGIGRVCDCLAADLAPKVRVNVVAPTLTPTEMGTAMVGGEKMLPMIEGRHPLKNSRRGGNRIHHRLSSLGCSHIDHRSDSQSGCRTLHATLEFMIAKIPRLDFSHLVSQRSSPTGQPIPSRSRFRRL